MKCNVSFHALALLTFLSAPAVVLAQTAGSPTDFSQYFFNPETGQKMDWNQDQRKAVNGMLWKAMQRNQELMAAGCKNPKDLETKRKCYDLRSKKLDIDISSFNSFGKKAQ